MDMETARTLTEEQNFDISNTLTSTIIRLESIHKFAMDVINSGDDIEDVAISASAIKDIAIMAAMSLEELNRRVTGDPGVRSANQRLINMGEPWRKSKEEKMPE